MSSTSERRGVTSWGRWGSLILKSIIKQKSCSSKITFENLSHCPSQWDASRGWLRFRTSHFERLWAASGNRFPPSISPSPQCTSSLSRVMTHATDFFFVFQLVGFLAIVCLCPHTCWIPDISVYPWARFTQALGLRHHYSVLFKGHLFSHIFKFILPSTPRPQSRLILHDGQPGATTGTVHTKFTRNFAKLPFWTLTIVNHRLDKKEVVKRLMW